MVLIAMSFNSKREKTGTATFQSKESTLFDIKGTLQKGHLHSFAEKGRGPDLKDLPSCVPVML